MAKLKLFSRLAAIGVILSFLATSCYNYNDDTTLDDLDLTLTYYDTAFNFQSYTTFAVRDCVGVVSNYLTDSDLTAFYAPNGGSNQIRNYVIDKFQALGYTLVSSDENYDFGVNLVALVVNTTVNYYPGWWYGYYGYYNWYYWGWYPYYPYYPWGGYYSYNYQTGTLLMEMVDGASLRTYRAWAAGKTQDEINNANPADVPDVYFRWQGLINGIASSSSGPSNSTRVENGIDEAFAQSPYLAKN